MSEETKLYEKFLKHVNSTLGMAGCYFDEADAKRNVIQRFISRKHYCFSIVMLSTHLTCDFIWLALEYKTTSMRELTYFIPCVILTLLACTKSYLLVRNGNYVTDLIKSTKSLQAISGRSGMGKKTRREFKKSSTILKAFINFNLIMYALGFVLFMMGPLILTALLYKSTGKLEMQLPFVAWYPFDVTDIRYWPFAYIHQIWAGFFDACVVYGSDMLYAISCTFLQIQFKTLQYDIGEIITEKTDINTPEWYENFRENFVHIIKRHQELIRCINVLELVYSKSNLCIITVASIVICISAFNMTTYDDIIWRTIFTAFLVVWLLQVFSLCNFSDLIGFSSTEISDAIYNSLWYKADIRVMKDFLFVLKRGHQPCKLTAGGYSDLNLSIFSKVVSTSWSYFALLQTMYSK